MSFDFQGVVLLALWLTIGTLMLSLVLAISLNKTLKARVAWVVVVVLAFMLFVAWADRQFFKQPWHTERPEARHDTAHPVAATTFDSTLDGGPHA